MWVIGPTKYPSRRRRRHAIPKTCRIDIPPSSTVHEFVRDIYPTVCTVGYKYAVGVADFANLLLQKFSNSLFTVGGHSGTGVGFDTEGNGIGEWQSVDVVEQTLCRRDGRA